jgi:hypothetical protein
VSILIVGFQFANGVIKKRARDQNGELIGKANPNLLLDTSVYEVALEDGSVERYHANILVEHIYDNLDEDGFTTSTFHSIVENRARDDVHKRGRSGSKTTTKGWTLCVKLSNGTTMWVSLSELKEARLLCRVNEPSF